MGQDIPLMELNHLDQLHLDFLKLYILFKQAKSDAFPYARSVAIEFSKYNLGKSLFWAI